MMFCGNDWKEKVRSRTRWNCVWRLTSGYDDDNQENDDSDD